MTATIIPFPPRAVLFVWPVTTNNGEWGIFIERGDSSRLLSTRFSLPEAIESARVAASLLGAVFDEGETA